MSAEPEDTCYQWSWDFVVAHAVFASGFITAPVAVLLLINRPRSGRAIIFAGFAAFCTAFSLILCLRFYAELRRPPWPRWCWRSAASGGGGQQQREGGEPVVAEHETTTTTSHALRHPEQPVMRRAEVQDALASGRIPSYEHPGSDGDGDGDVDCAVCLGEVEKGEMMRRLPACQHVFHRECIDLWLRAHATCPVCRSGVLPVAAPERAVEEVVVDIGAVRRAQHSRATAILAPPPPGIVFSGRLGHGLWFGPVSRMS